MKDWSSCSENMWAKACEVFSYCLSRDLFLPEQQGKEKKIMTRVVRKYEGLICEMLKTSVHVPSKYQTPPSLLLSVIIFHYSAPQKNN